MQKRMLATAVALSLLLGGCSSSPATPVHTATATATPAFASDADALAAAEAAYAKYQAMEDTISHEGGKDPDRIRPFASRDALEDALSGYQTLLRDNVHSTGTVSIDGERLVGFKPNSPSGVNVLLFDACLDVGAVDLIDSSGRSTILGSRVSRQTFQFSFDFQNGSLVLSSREKISEKSLCG